jgi:acetylornithine aminotransferase
MDDKVTITRFAEIQKKSEKYLLGNYSRQEICFEYGVGEYLFDTEGKRYLDFQSGIAVTNLGHCEADIIDAIREQSDKLFHTSNLFYSAEQAQLAEVLVENSFPGKVFFCNSGTEANEAAFKLARKFAVSRNIEKPIILSMKGSFHGRTTASMMMTGQEKIRTGFGTLLDGFDYIQENDTQDLEAKFRKYQGRIAAVIAEPILGEYGVVPLELDFLILLRKLCSENNAILIFDEIQTGIGRTGKLFCFQHTPFSPDVMTLAKGLGNGFPIGAVVIGEKFKDYLTPGSHGSTFGGNHLAARVAYETLRVILTRDILSVINGLSEFAFRRLRVLQNEFPKIIQEVRGIGLHIGIELKIPSKPIATACLHKGLIINSTNEKCLRIMPPINISIERIDEGISILESVLNEVKV